MFDSKTESNNNNYMLARLVELLSNNKGDTEAKESEKRDRKSAVW
jgi:hypothetical protein